MLVSYMKLLNYLEPLRYLNLHILQFTQSNACEYIIDDYIACLSLRAMPFEEKYKGTHTHRELDK